MSKEELKKEAIQYAVDYPTSYGKGYKHKDLSVAYLAGAEPREKRITELEKACNETQELLDKQIEATYKVVEENNELKKRNGELAGQKASLERWLGEAKAIIKDIISSYGSTEVSEAQLYLKMKRAEKFLEEVK